MNFPHLPFTAMPNDNTPTDIASAARDALKRVPSYDELAKQFVALTERMIRAENTLKTAGYVDGGGSLWKPPIGPRPAFLDEPSVEFSDHARQRVLDEAKALDDLLAAAKNVLAFSAADDHINKLREEFLTYLQTLEHYDQ